MKDTTIKERDKWFWSGVIIGMILGSSIFGLVGVLVELFAR